MTKILYHGSSYKFDNFDLEKAKENTTTSHLVEGDGIYLTEDKKLASAYGRYLYEIHYSYDSYKDSLLLSWDFEEMKELVEKLANEFFNDSSFFYGYIGTSKVEELCNLVVDGELSIMKFQDELYLWLDCCGFYFEEDEDRFNYDKVWFNLLPPVVEYYDKTFDGLICICHKETNKLTINNITDLAN